MQLSCLPYHWLRPCLRKSVCENITLTKSYHRLVLNHFFLDWNISRLRIALAKCIAYYVDIKILVITEARATTLKLHIREVQFLSLRYQMFPGQLGFRHGSCCKLLKNSNVLSFFRWFWTKFWLSTWNMIWLYLLKFVRNADC